MAPWLLLVGRFVFTPMLLLIVFAAEPLSSAVRLTIEDFPPSTLLFAVALVGLTTLPSSSQAVAATKDGGLLPVDIGIHSGVGGGVSIWLPPATPPAAAAVVIPVPPVEAACPDCCCCCCCCCCC
uniref:Putative secreted peptide n=1 Tax=Anopheles braziliensis TaxID=58242 RepID=A0A2M3ZQ88_9DIPT